MLLHHYFGEVGGKVGAWGHARGGMGAITQAMVRAAEARGVETEVEAPVAEALVEDARAVGAALDDGRALRAKAVAANVNPKMLVLELVEPSVLDPELRRAMTAWRCRSGTFRMNVALSELPTFEGLPAGATVERYAPNFARAVVGRQVLSPLDLERELGLTGGDIFHGALHPDQIYSRCPATPTTACRLRASTSAARARTRAAASPARPATTPRARSSPTSGGGGWPKSKREFTWDGILISRLNMVTVYYLLQRDRPMLKTMDAGEIPGFILTLS